MTNPSLTAVAQLIAQWRARAHRLGVDAEPGVSEEANLLDDCADDLEAALSRPISEPAPGRGEG